MVNTMSLKFCLNSSTIKPSPLLDKIKLAAKHGFAGIELWINEIYEHVGRGGEVSEVEMTLADHGLTVPCMIAMRGWGDASEAEYPLMLEEAQRRMELAARLGSPLIVATPPREPCSLDQVSRRYRDLLELGRQVGVKPVMEYIGFFGSVYHLNQAWQIVLEANSPDATLVVDAFHNFRGGATLQDLRSIPIERIAHYHIDDAPAEPPREQQSDPDRVMVGDGILDLKSELDYLRQSGYQGFVSLELFNRELWFRDPNDVLATGINRMRQLIDQA